MSDSFYPEKLEVTTLYFGDSFYAHYFADMHDSPDGYYFYHKKYLGDGCCTSEQMGLESISWVICLGLSNYIGNRYLEQFF